MKKIKEKKNIIIISSIALLLIVISVIAYNEIKSYNENKTFNALVEANEVATKYYAINQEVSTYTFGEDETTLIDSEDTIPLGTIVTVKDTMVVNDKEYYYVSWKELEEVKEAFAEAETLNKNMLFEETVESLGYIPNENLNEVGIIIKDTNIFLKKEEIFEPTDKLLNTGEETIILFVEDEYSYVLTKKVTEDNIVTEESKEEIIIEEEPTQEEAITEEEKNKVDEEIPIEETVGPDDIIFDDSYFTETEPAIDDYEAEFDESDNNEQKELIKIKNMQFEQKTIKTTPNSKINLNLIVNPKDHDENIKYSSSDTNIANVDESGTVTVNNKIGTVTITAKSEKLTAICKIKVNPIKVTSISIRDLSKRNFGIGEELQITTKVLPLNATNKNVRYVSSNPSVATVTPTGLLIPKKVGETKITAISTDTNKKSTTKVTVKKPTTKIEITNCPKTIKVGKTYDLNSTANKEGSFIRTYSSSNSAVAIVDNAGIVNAKKAGTVQITVKTYNKLKDTCTIKIVK
ncbi:MAG: Ig domain-containing protein [Bacilli bacterium]